MSSSSTPAPMTDQRAGSSPNRFVLVHSDPGKRKELGQVLRTITKQVDVRSDLEWLGEDAPYDLLLVDYDGLSPTDRGRLIDVYSREARPTRLLLVSGRDCKKDFARLFGNRTLTNLMGKSEHFLGEELIVTVNKLLSEDIFGIEKYFAWGIKPVSFRVRSSADKNEIVEKAREYTAGIGVHPRLAELFCTVTDEFVSNAIYNAPVDDSGHARYAHLTRDRDVTLNPGEVVEVRFCSDGRRLGVSVTDFFGSITKAKVLDELTRSFRNDDHSDSREGQGGAGVGIYFTFECLSHFVVNINPKKMTEMIGLMDVRGSFREFLDHGKSFNVFVVE